MLQNSFFNTYDDDELDHFKRRLENCRDRAKIEGGEFRIVCLCRVLKDIKTGNGGEIPVPEWEQTFNQLRCNTDSASQPKSVFPVSTETRDLKVKI